jgi:hypothetical protein
MNEFERFVSSIDRPEPSERLDNSIRSLLANGSPRLDRHSSLTRFAWCVVAAFAGLIGFFAGRMTVSPELQPPVIAVKDSTPKAPEAARLLSLSPSTDLASLLVRSNSGETMFGKGPMRIAVSTSP